MLNSAQLGGTNSRACWRTKNNRMLRVRSWRAARLSRSNGLTGQLRSIEATLELLDTHP